MRLVSRLLAGHVLLAACTLADVPNVPNNDFEMPVLPPPYVGYGPVPGWTHTGTLGIGTQIRAGYEDSLGSVGSAGHGKQFLLLGAQQATPGNASWSTVVTGLTPGTTYTLGFLMSSQLPRIATTISVSFETGTFTPGQSFMVSPLGIAYWGTWEAKQMNFLATANSLTLVFSVANQKSEIGLDYVTVVEAAPVLVPPSVTAISSPIATGVGFSPGSPLLVTGANLGSSASDIAEFRVKGEPAPVLKYIDSSDVLIQMPVDIPAGFAGVTATRNGATTVALIATIKDFGPGIYYPGASAFSDTGGAAITAAHPVIPGTPVTCVALGLGPTNPPMVTGQAAASAAPTTNKVQVTIGNRTIDADSATLLTGSVTDYLVTITVPPETPAGQQPTAISVGGIASNTVTLFVSPPIPVINAVVNGANFKAVAASPNSFVSLFGISFGGENTPGNIFPAETFNDVFVSVNGIKTPLYNVFGKQGQINIVLPAELPEFGTALIQVTNAQGASAPFQIQLAPDSVGLFRIIDPSKPGRMNGAVLFANSAWKVMPLSMASALGLPQCSSITKASVCGEPAKIGDQVQIYLTGLGKATPNGDPKGLVLPTGSLAPADGSVLYKTVQTPAVTIGGVAADVSFSGIAPGSAGQYQINVAIPDGVKPGNDVPLVVTMPDGSSDTVTIAIQASS